MKEDVFNQYVRRISDLFGITKNDLFSKSKVRHIVDARQLLYYLCFNRKMQVVTIKKYMSDNGYNIAHNSINNGIEMIEKKIKEDKDYKTVINDIDKAVFI